MRLQFGCKAGPKVPLAGEDEARPKHYVRMRKLTWPERDEYDRLSRTWPPEAFRYLVTTMVVEFILPSGESGDEVYTSAPEDENRQRNVEALLTADDELADWLVMVCVEATGNALQIKALELARQGIAVTEDRYRRWLEEVQADARSKEAVLGNSGASPGPTGEAASERSAT